MVLNIRVLTPANLVLFTTGNSVFLPSTTGIIEIQNNHTRLMTTLQIGVLRVKKNGRWDTLITYNGIAEVNENNVLILVSGTEDGNNRTRAQAQIDLEIAILALKNANTKKERIVASIEVKKAAARLEATYYLNLDKKD
jgi:F-type H+-transporting ATPase subunit epsilon